MSLANLLFVLLSLTFCCGVLSCGTYGPIRKSFHGYKVFRFRPETREQLDALTRQLPVLSRGKVDFWTRPTTLNQPVDLMVDSWTVKLVEAFSRHFKFTGTEVVCDDVQSLISSNSQFKPWGEANKSLESFFDSYQRLTEIHSFLDRLVEEYPDRASTKVIGKSFEGRDLKVIKISAPSKGQEAKKIVWIDSGIHAREWISPTTSLYLAHQLLSQYGKNDLVTASLDAFDFIILPSTNPDGYVYTHKEDRLWRKTRSTGHPNCCVGVDANRNFDWHWGELYVLSRESFDDPCTEIYAGPRPFSEKESKAVADYLTDLKNKDMVEVYLTLHSYSQLWMFPWGHTAEPALRDAIFRAKAKVAVDAIEKVAGTEYKYGSISTIIYPVTGDTASWAHGVGIPHAYAVELPPKQESIFEGGFVLPPSKIVPIGKETSVGILSMIRSIAQDGDL